MKAGFLWYKAVKGATRFGKDVLFQLVEYALVFIPPMLFMFFPISIYLKVSLSCVAIVVAWIAYYKLRRKQDRHYRG